MLDDPDIFLSDSTLRSISFRSLFYTRFTIVPRLTITNLTDPTQARTKIFFERQVPAFETHQWQFNSAFMNEARIKTGYAVRNSWSKSANIKLSKTLARRPAGGTPVSADLFLPSSSKMGHS
uniref:Uncharacterized protein n=1 Tax=Utricularia reniformis TaxID=192314 RepID=A0A1Y0B0G6_9LAMI|nr:hypothetical protein AEK19_MT0624 [Utricularia reniformis]ART30879.1 hypothetical protein AEK19_MT0624 [Utricularia reniformis]